MYILNGDSKDGKERRYTFIGHGTSAIDFAIIKGKACYKIEVFTI